MNFLGFIGLIAVIAVMAWWFGFLGQDMEPAPNTTESVLENTLNAAQNAADQLGN